MPFSLQVTLGQDCPPSRIGTASGATLGLTVRIGGLAGSALSSLTDAASLQTALAPLLLMPVLSRLLFGTLHEPDGPRRRDTTPTDTDTDTGDGASAAPTTPGHHSFG